MEAQTDSKQAGGNGGRTTRGGRRLVAVAVAGVVVLAPLLVGGGPVWAQLVCVSAVFLVGLLCAVTRRFELRSVAFALPAALAVAVTAVQLVPLPAWLVGLLSPRSLELRAEVAAAPPAFVPITLDVPATTLEVSKALACLTLLLVVGMTAEGRRARPIVLALAFVGGAVALVHLVQRAAGADTILGFYPNPDTAMNRMVGTFVNHNHASSLLALSALVAAGLAMEVTGVLRVAAGASALASVGVLVSTSSRSGVLGLAAGALVLGMLVFSRRFGARRGIPLAVGLFVALSAIGLWGAAGLRARLWSAVTGGLAAEQKLRGWRDALGVVAAHPWTGVGRGAFEAPATAFRSHSEGVRLVVPESLPLQLASEWGLPFAVVITILVAAGGLRLARVLPRLAPSAQAAGCGALAALVHELGDFALELPGVAFPAIAALGVAVAQAQRRTDPARQTARRIGPPWVLVGLAGFAAALAGSAWALPRTLDADGRRAREALAARSPTARAELAAAIRRHPADYYLEMLAAIDAIERGDPAAARHLGRAQRLHPMDGNAHLATARWLARQGRRSQAALEYRLARERLARVDHDEVLRAVGPAHLADATPQTEAALLDIARWLLGAGHVAEAWEASRRAVALGGEEASFQRRLELALASPSIEFVQEAARDLLSVAREPSSFVLAAQALEKAGRSAAADAAIERGLVAYPRNSAIILAGGRLKLARGDLGDATELLQRGDARSLTLQERIDFDELRADIAEKRGHPASAAALRARARSLERMTGAGGER